MTVMAVKSIIYFCLFVTIAHLNCAPGVICAFFVRVCVALKLLTVSEELNAWESCFFFPLNVNSEKDVH